MGVTVVTSGGGVDVQVGAGAVTVATSQKILAPSEWDDKVAAYGLGYHLTMPTTQSIIYRTGDDKDIEDTVIVPARLANAGKVKNELTSFWSLRYNNIYGNNLRFSDRTGGTAYADGYLIDHYTGYGWRVSVATWDGWNNTIDRALISTFAGYTDWFVPNFIQIETIRQWGGGFDFPPYNNGNGSVWTSTTRWGTTQANYTNSNQQMRVSDKANFFNAYNCRVHNFSE